VVAADLGGVVMEVVIVSRLVVVDGVEVRVDFVSGTGCEVY